MRSSSNRHETRERIENYSKKFCFEPIFFSTTLVEQRCRLSICLKIIPWVDDLLRNYPKMHAVWTLEEASDYAMMCRMSNACIILHCIWNWYLRIRYSGFVFKSAKAKLFFFLLFQNILADSDLTWNQLSTAEEARFLHKERMGTAHTWHVFVDYYSMLVQNVDGIEVFPTKDIAILRFFFCN